MTDETNIDQTTDRTHLVHDYDAALDYLYSFINFEKKRQDRYMASKMDPTRPGRLMHLLGDPQQTFPAIHVAGTKGKGSVSAMCAFILRAAGYKVGLHTSPHLVEFRERIRVLTPQDADGRIAQADFVQHVQRIQQIVPQIPDVTWFEIVTAIAFLHFAQAEVDVAVVEVGLGGRLDATNVLTPLVSVITSLSMDHTLFLGDTLAQIAFEKGGIIKPGIPVVTAPQPPEALDRLTEIAAERNAPLTVVGNDWQFGGGEPMQQRDHQQLTITQAPPDALLPAPAALTVGLTGDHQLENATVALAALTLARPFLPHLSETAVRQGLAGVQWPGRLQLLLPASDEAPMFLVDCAHNPDSAAKLRDALTHHYRYNRLWLILGAPADKDVAGIMAKLLPLAAGAFMTTASHLRSVPPAELVRMSADLGYDAAAMEDMETAVVAAWQRAQPGDLICVTGSIIVVGDLLNQWERLKSTLTQPQSNAA